MYFWTALGPRAGSGGEKTIVKWLGGWSKSRRTEDRTPGFSIFRSVLLPDDYDRCASGPDSEIAPIYKGAFQIYEGGESSVF